MIYRANVVFNALVAGANIMVGVLDHSILNGIIGGACLMGSVMFIALPLSPPTNLTGGK